MYKTPLAELQILITSAFTLNVAGVYSLMGKYAVDLQTLCSCIVTLVYSPAAASSS